MDKGVSNWDLDNRLNSLEREVRRLRRLRRLASEDGSTGGEELLLPTPIIKNILNPGKGIICYESIATDDDEMFFNEDGSKNRTFIKDIDMSYARIFFSRYSNGKYVRIISYIR